MENDALTQVRAQRAALAARARLPWWFWVLFALATLGLVGGPLLTTTLSPVVAAVVQVVSILVYLLADRLVRWRRGVTISSAVLRAYPSARAAGTGFVVVVAVGVVAVTWLAAHGVLAAAVVVTLGTAAVALALMAVAQRAVVADIREGRVRAS
jgi:hypothetical protein